MRVKHTPYTRVAPDLACDPTASSLLHKFTASSPWCFLGAPRSSVASGAGLEPGAPRRALAQDVRHGYLGAGRTTADTVPHAGTWPVIGLPFRCEEVAGKGEAGPPARYWTRAAPHTAAARQRLRPACVAPASGSTGSGSVRRPAGDRTTQRRLRCGTARWDALSSSL